MVGRAGYLETGRTGHEPTVVARRLDAIAGAAFVSMS